MLALLVRSAGAQGLPAAQVRAFDRGDRESQSLISQVRCAGLTVQAREEKRLAPIDTAVDATECIIVGTHYVVVFIGGDTLFRHPSSVSGYDLTGRTWIAGAVDTAGVLAIARAEWDGVRRGISAFESANRQFVPMAFRFDGDTIEVWLIPASVISGSPYSLGGEHGYIYSPDGSSVVREVDRFAGYRAIAVADTGLVNLPSTEDGVPTLTEFYLANQLNARGRDVAIVMPGLTSVLRGKGAQAVWVQLVHH